MLTNRFNECGPLLVAGVDGSLGAAVARTMAASAAILGVTSTHEPLGKMVYDEAASARTAAALPDNVVALDSGYLKSSAEVAALLSAAEGSLGKNYAVVFCGKIVPEVGAGGTRQLVANWVEHGLGAIANASPDSRPCAVVIAARVLPPATAEEATVALHAIVDERLGGSIPHRIVAVEDPHAAACVRAFGLMDRPFGKDFEAAQRREAAAARAVRDFLVTTAPKPGVGLGNGATPASIRPDAIGEAPAALALG